MPLTYHFGIMKRIILCLAALSYMIIIHAGNNSNVTKVFQADIDSIYNFYIDSIGSTSGDVEFCFQTVSGYLVKTDIDGTIISKESNPYKYFTVYDGDTLVLSNGSVIKGDDTIANARDTLCRLIAASHDGLFVYWGGDIDARGGSWSWQVHNILGVDNFDKNMFYSTPISGLSVYKDSLYAIQYFYNRIVSVNINTKRGITRDISFISQPVGIAGYKGKLFVFSNADRTLYRLEQSDDTGFHSVLAPIKSDVPVYFGLDGKESDPNEPGIHIVKYPDGSVKKQVVR